jgi:hypothetical protein
VIFIKEKMINTAIRIKPSEKEYLENRAKDMGITFSEILKTGAMMCASFDPAFWKGIKNLSYHLGVKEYLILQNIAISWLARREAEAEVKGDEADALLPEFVFTENGPVTGEELHKNMKKIFIQYYKKQK